MERRALTESDLRRMMVPARYWDVRLSKINEDYRDYVIRYLVGLDKAFSEGVGLLLFGPNGVGKTGAAVAVLKEVRRRGYRGLFVEAFMLMDIFLGRIKFDDEKTVYDRMLEVDFLVIDDLGKGTGDKTGFLVSKLEALLRARYDERKVTFITTNLNPRQLGDYFSASGMSILRAIVMPVHCEGRDMRAESEQADKVIKRALVKVSGKGGNREGGSDKG